MHPEAVRVVYENQPYLVVCGNDGSVERAYGPFSPGTEPSLKECHDGVLVEDVETLTTLQELIPISPPLPEHADTLAGSR